MAEKKCPACKGMVPDDAHACPFCPYSFPDEEEAGIEQLRQQQSWSPLPIILGVAAAAVVGALYFTMGKGGENLPGEMSNMERAALQAKGKPVPELMEKLKTGKGTVAPVAAHKSEEVEEPAQDGAEASQTVFISHSGSDKAPPVVKEWKMRGMVYDLTTLNPVPKCKMVFSDEQANARFETMADASGRYRMILPPLDGRGYSVSMHQPGYSASYLNPGTENVRSLSQSERAQMSRDLSGSVMTPYTVEPNSADPLITDFYLAPTR